MSLGFPSQIYVWGKAFVGTVPGNLEWSGRRKYPKNLNNYILLVLHPDTIDRCP